MGTYLGRVDSIDELKSITGDEGDFYYKNKANYDDITYVITCNKGKWEEVIFSPDTSNKAKYTDEVLVTVHFNACYNMMYACAKEWGFLAADGKISKGLKFPPHPSIDVIKKVG